MPTEPDPAHSTSQSEGERLRGEITKAMAYLERTRLVPDAEIAYYILRDAAVPPEMAPEIVERNRDLERWDV